MKRENRDCLIEKLKEEQMKQYKKQKRTKNSGNMKKKQKKLNWHNSNLVKGMCQNPNLLAARKILLKSSTLTQKMKKLKAT